MARTLRRLGFVLLGLVAVAFILRFPGEDERRRDVLHQRA